MTPRSVLLASKAEEVKVGSLAALAKGLEDQRQSLTELKLGAVGRDAASKLAGLARASKRDSPLPPSSPGGGATKAAGAVAVE